MKSWILTLLLLALFAALPKRGRRGKYKPAGYN